MRSFLILFLSFCTLYCWGNDNELTNFCQPSKTLHCGEIYQGSTTHERNDVRHYNGCENGTFNGRDKVFKIVKPNQRGRLTVNLWNNRGLDLFLLNNCNDNHVNCIGSSLIDSNTPYAGISGVTQAGTYYVSVDAMNHDVHGDFTLSATCGALDCHNAEEVYCKQKVSGNTNHGDNDISAIKCDNRLYGGYTGKEKLYYFEVTRHETVTIDLTGLDHHADLDLFLMRECDEYSTIACSMNRQNGRNERIVKNLAPGKYYVLIDGYKGSNSKFDLKIDWNCCENEVIDHCNDITSQYIGSNGVLKYRFQVPNNSLYLGATWIVKGGQYGNNGIEIGSGFSTEWTFPSAGEYTVCVKYPLQHGHNCYAYCCKKIKIEEHCEDVWDYNCNYIKYDGSGFNYTFSNTSNNTVLGWTISGGSINGTQSIGSGNSVSYTFPGAGEYTICFKYRTHDGCFYYCCKKIIIDPCEDVWDYNCNYIKYDGSGFNYTFSNTSNNTVLGWTISGGSINGTQSIGSGNSVSYTFPGAGEYTICFKYRTHDGCFYYCCKKIVVRCPEDVYDYHCNYIKYDDSGFNYTFSNTSSNTVLEWTISGGSINGTQSIGSGNSVSYTFPGQGEYTICFKYRDHNGCFYYCCKKIIIRCEDEYDYHCDKINYSFAGTSSALTYNFVNTSSESNGTWVIRNGSSSGDVEIGSGNNISYTFSAPGEYTICYRYKKQDGCYYYCCKKICVEYPFDCRLIRKRFDYHTGKYTLSLDGVSTENILRWKDEGTGQTLGTGATITIDNPFQCVIISVFYKDPHTGCYKVCCIQLCRVCYGEKDLDCNAIDWYANGNGFQYGFKVPSGGDYANGTWTISGARYGRDVINGGSGSTLNWTFPSAGKYTVCYTYTTYDGSKFSCCKTIWIQHPGECGLINSEYDEFSQQYVLNLSGAEQVQWRNDQTGQIIGSGSSIKIGNPFNCVFISAIFFDAHTGCYRVCRIELCPYEKCFGLDPYFSAPWLGSLVENLSQQCSNNPDLVIETARYKGKCVIIVPPVKYECGSPTNESGYVFDAAGNLIFSYGGVNENYNTDRLNDLRNREVFWRCSGGLANQPEEGEVESRVAQVEKDYVDVALVNQPNPFSSETLIRFTLPEAARATLRIVDALGKTIFELEEDFTAGENEVFFNNEQELPSGIYFLRLESEQMNSTHTMVVEKQ